MKTPDTKPSNELEISRVPSSLDCPQHGSPLYTSVSGMGGQTTLCGEDSTLHNSLGAMHVAFHMKSAPGNWVMPHLEAGIFLSSWGISSGVLHLAFSPQPSSGLELSLWTKMRQEELPHQNTSAGVFSHLLMPSLEISLSASSLKNSFDPLNVLCHPAEIYPELVPKSVSAAEFS